MKAELAHSALIAFQARRIAIRRAKIVADVARARVQEQYEGAVDAAEREWTERMADILEEATRNGQ